MKKRQSHKDTKKPKSELEKNDKEELRMVVVISMAYKPILSPLNDISNKLDGLVINKKQNLST